MHIKKYIVFTISRLASFLFGAAADFLILISENFEM